MADYLAPKTAGEVVQRRWGAPVDSDDGAQSLSVSTSGVTVDVSSLEGNDVVLTLSGGTAAQTASVVVTVSTSRGRTLIETLYIPVVDSAAQTAPTARDLCNFALRKLVGIAGSADAAELAAALGHLNDMIAAMREAGADVGAPYPLTADSIVYCPDYALDALRYNLRVRVYNDYGEDPSATDVLLASRGMQAVKRRNRPDARPVGFY